MTAERAEPLRQRIAELESKLARSEENAQMWFDIVEARGKALRRLRDALQRIYEFDRTDMGDGGYFLPGVCGRIASEALEPDQAYDSAPTDPHHGGKVWKE